MYLSLFDFTIPIRAFDQTNGDLTVVPFCQLIKVVNDTPGTESIGLNDNARRSVSMLNPSEAAFTASAKVFDAPPIRP